MIDNLDNKIERSEVLQLFTAIGTIILIFCLWTLLDSLHI
jgi:hypothetical protein